MGKFYNNPVCENKVDLGTVCKSLRGLAYQPYSSLYESVIERKVRNIIMPLPERDQNGYRRNRST